MKYNHIYDIAFTVISEREDGADVTAEMLRDAIVRRLAATSDQELLNEAVGGPMDTYPMEEEEESIR